MKTFLSAFVILGLIILPSQAMAANLTGSVNFSGTAPAADVIKMNADPTCMSAHPTPVTNPEVIVNSNNTLKNVFVYVKTGLEGKTFETPKEPVKFDQSGCLYTPHVMGAQVNQDFEIINSDSTLHNVHAMPTAEKEFNLGMPIKGMKVKKKFTTPEIMVKIKCDVHPWMRAYVGVLPHPYFGVTGDDGSFTIKDLPPGKYTIEAWHEKYGTQTQEITVTESGDATANFEYKAA
ncbi:MAG TPA: carboxypeptidase regulatory-like domain-containing protein [Verrucomicrobiae bacterium]|nr:carboxypeptidase regulatory-like domain-containing protein [Verrucomicrobiae bacterium]